MTNREYIPGAGVWEAGDRDTPGEWVADECPCCHRLIEPGDVCEDGACVDCPEWTPEWAAEREASE